MGVKEKAPAHVSNSSLSPAEALFIRRVTRLEQVSIEIRNLYPEIAQLEVAERQSKANVYLTTDAKSHGEREGLASHHSVSIVCDKLLLKGQLARLEEERDHLRFLIEFDTGG